MYINLHQSENSINREKTKSVLTVTVDSRRTYDPKRFERLLTPKTRPRLLFPVPGVGKSVTVAIALGPIRMLSAESPGYWLTTARAGGRRFAGRDLRHN
jgi:hypothetical protein